jgi:hypothetical protein
VYISTTESGALKGKEDKVVMDNMIKVKAEADEIISKYKPEIQKKYKKVKPSG